MKQAVVKTVAVVFVALAAAPVAAWAQAAAPAVEKVSVKAIAHFDFDRARIRPEEQAKILSEVGQMKDVTWQTVVTTGYTDNVGAEDYNSRLSARRAEAVKAYLVGKGLDPAMIQAAGKGEHSPIADNTSEDGRSRNRRTEIEFQGIRSGAK